MQKTANLLYHKRRSFLMIAALLVSALLLVSCGSSKTAAAYDNAAYPPEPPSASTSGIEVTFGGAQSAPSATPSVAATENKGLGDNGATVQATSSNLLSQRKMIMEGNVSLETFNFDDSVARMDQMIQSWGGFAETRAVKGKGSYYEALRSASYIIRVPSESFERVLKEMGSIGTVLESNSHGTDITDQYTDSETRIKTLKVQEQTLLDILAKATKLEDVITLESRIAEVRYEIERLENTLKNYDRLVSFSRISVYIQEIDEKTETKPVMRTLNERISGSFSESLLNFKSGFEDFLVWFVGSWITLLFLLGIGVILFLMIRSRRKKKQSRNVQIPEVKVEKKE